MVVIGELVHVHTFRIERLNLPSISEEVIRLRDGGTRKVYLEIIDRFDHLTQGFHFAEVTATLLDCRSGDMLLGTMCNETVHGHKNIMTESYADIKTRYWRVERREGVNMGVEREIGEKITLFLQIMSDDGALYTRQEAEKEMQRNSVSALSKDFAAMMKSGLMADTTIVCEETRFPAHKAILSARSEVFCAMFSHKDTLESQQNEVLIKDVGKATMERFLAFLYEASLPKDFDFDCFAELLKVADKYRVASLTEVCAMKLAKNIGIDNAVLGAILGSHYNNQELKNEAIKAIVKSGDTLSSMSGYQELRGYPNLLIEIVDSFASGRK